MIDNYPPGAANDPRAPYNQPVIRSITAEVTVELGTFIDCDIEGCYDDEIKEAVTNKATELYGDEVTDVHIWNWRYV